MLNLPVDPSYAFDYLSILYLKEEINPSIVSLRMHCEKCLESQINPQLWEQIISSEEFQSLIDTNREVFRAVELARYGDISAKEVDDKNMSRFYAKKRLQDKFFPNNPLTEWKT